MTSERIEVEVRQEHWDRAKEAGRGGRWKVARCAECPVAQAVSDHLGQPPSLSVLVGPTYVTIGRSPNEVEYAMDENGHNIVLAFDYQNTEPPVPLPIKVVLEEYADEQ